MQLIRLASLAAGTLVLGLAIRVSAQDDDAELAAAVSIYADDDDVTVVSPAANFRLPIGERAALSGDVTVDVVSAASIDVVSQATPHVMEERRVEGEIGASVAPFADVPELELDLRAIGSTETDYDAVTVGGGLRYEAFQRSTTFILSYSAGFDEVGRAHDPSFGRSRRSHRLIGTVTQILDSRTYLDLVLDGTALSGYQASPYRFVPIFDRDQNRLYSLTEAVPEDRVTGAALVRVRRAFGSPPVLYVHGDYRFYGDDWGITSHTLGLKGLLPLLDERLTVSAEGRAYFQGAADFWESHYRDTGTGAPSIRTRDRILGGMRTLSGQLGVDVAIGATPREPDLLLLAGVSVLRFSWSDYPLQSGRSAVIATLGASAPF